MRPLVPLLILAGCQIDGSLEIKDDGLVDTGTTITDLTAPGDADTDADTDSDTDTDADTDSDADADTAIVSTGDTSVGIPGPLPPDHVVDCNGGGDFLTIQDAIDASVSGDRIGVEACTYHERIDFIGKTIEVYGIQGSMNTIIDGDENGTVVNVESGEGLGTRMAGFTVTGGDDDDDGSAFQIEMSAIELEDIVMTGNGESWSVLYAMTGWVELENVTITGNDVMSDGQAIYSKSGSMTARNLLVDCDGGLQAMYHHNALVLEESQLDCSSGHGLYDYHGEDNLRTSIFTGGISGIYAHDTESTPEEPDTPNERFNMRNSVAVGGQYGVDVRYMDIDVRNSVMIGADAALTMLENMAGSSGSSNVYSGGMCGIVGDMSFTSTYTAFWDNITNSCGAVNVNPVVVGNPMFVNMPYDFHLQAGSPLIDAGNPNAAYDDLDGSRNDIGAFGGPLALP